MESIKILFRIPFTLYFLGWDRDFKLFRILIKKFNGQYFWRFVE